MNDIIKNLAEKYNIKLQKNECCSGDRSFVIVCNRIIFIGEYDDPEKELISFFHELGHIKMFEIYPLDEIKFYSTVAYESLAWIVGLDIARKEGYEFSEKTLVWAREQLKTYGEQECNY